MTFTKHSIASERCMMEDGQALIALHSFLFSFYFSTACLQGFFYSIYPPRFDHIQYKVHSTKTWNTTISNHLSSHEQCEVQPQEQGRTHICSLQSAVQETNCRQHQHPSTSVVFQDWSPHPDSPTHTHLSTKPLHLLLGPSRSMEA